MCGYNRKYNSLKPMEENKSVERLSFYHHLRIYLIINLILLSISVSGGASFFFWPMTIFWGMGVMSHYQKVFFNKQQRLRGRNDDELVELSDPKPTWKERDLV